MDALVAPVPPVDAASWRAASTDAKSKLAGLAVRRAGAVRFRVTDHEVRTAFAGDAPGPDVVEPFAWSARTARRSIGVAAVRLLAGGAARSPSRPCGTGWPSPRAGWPTAALRRPSSTAGWPGSLRRDERPSAPRP